MMVSLKSSLFFMLALLTVVHALNFDIPAKTNPEPFCLREYVGEKNLVIVNLKTTGNMGDGQTLSMMITDSSGNTHSSIQNVLGEKSVAFDVDASAMLDICFLNTLTPGMVLYLKVVFTSTAILICLRCLDPFLSLKKKSFMSLAF